MNRLNPAYQSQLQVPPPLFSNDVFTHLLQNLASTKFESDEMLSLLGEFFVHHRLVASDFPFARNSYTRTILLREKSGFEILITRWDKGGVTPIHGHPRYSMMYLVEGELEERFYLLDQKQLIGISTLHYSPNDYSYHNGDDNYDNAIHKLTAKKNSLSIHIYSDDALKGNVFSIV